MNVILRRYTMKKRILVVMFAGLLFSASPSFAVDSFTIKSVTVGDNSVGISFNHAERSDKYTIRRILICGSIITNIIWCINWQIITIDTTTSRTGLIIILVTLIVLSCVSTANRIGAHNISIL